MPVPGVELGPEEGVVLPRRVDYEVLLLTPGHDPPDERPIPSTFSVTQSKFPSFTAPTWMSTMRSLYQLEALSTKTERPRSLNSGLHSEISFRSARSHSPSSLHPSGRSAAPLYSIRRKREVGGPCKWGLIPCDYFHVLADDLGSDQPLEHQRGLGHLHHLLQEVEDVP